MLAYRSSNNTDGDSNNGQLLREIEEISKALYLDKTPSSNARSKSAGRVRLSESKSSLNYRLVRENSLYKDKKSSSSAWNWKKPLKALAHIGDKKFHCRFYLHVHSIEGLPSNFDHLSLCVHWKRKNEVVSTSPSKISRGVAEFEETLITQCSVYGSTSGPKHPVKYESKFFLLYTSLVEAPGLDIGKQWVDVTSFLPRTLEELEGEKSRGQWNTSFSLSGKAKGASLNVSFGFWVMRDKLPNSHGGTEFPRLISMVQNSKSAPEDGINIDPNNRNKMVSSTGRVPGTLNYGAGVLRGSLDVKVCHEVLLRTGIELSNSINCLYEKLDDGGLCISDRSDSQQPEKHKAKLDLDFISAEEIEGYNWDITELGTTEMGTEIFEIEHANSDQASVHANDCVAIKRISMDELSKDDYIEFEKIVTPYIKNDNLMIDSKSEGVMISQKDNNCIKGLTAIEERDSLCDSQISEATDLNPFINSSEYAQKKNHVDSKSNYKRSRSAKRSLSLDAVAETVASDFFKMLEIDYGSFRASSDNDPESPRELLLREFEEEALASDQSVFYFNTKDDGSHVDYSSDPGFIDVNDSKESGLSLIIYDSEEEHKRVSGLLMRRNAKILEDLETEALMQDWGLNENDFKNSPRAYSGGFGSPIEFLPEEVRPLPPLEEGFGPFVKMKNGGFLWSMNPSLFRNAKNGGSLVIQVSSPAVLPAKMGYKVMDIIQNLALVGAETLYKQINRLVPLEDVKGKTIKQVSTSSDTNLVASHRTKINDPESVNFVDGTLVEFSSPENLSPVIVNKVEDLFLEGLKIQSQMSGEESSCIIPQPTRETLSSSELVGLSITLEEWLSLDAGNTGSQDRNSHRLSKILNAHHAEGINDQVSGKKCGVLGNDLTIFHLVQLLNPHRNYEPVGSPMLLLIQVHREFSGERNDARYRVTRVHLSGVNPSFPEKQLWGTVSQYQSGTRWLRSSGMARTVTGFSSKSKSNSKAIVRPSLLGLARSLSEENVLWSVSSNVCDVGVSWERLAMALHIRNPDVVIQSENSSVV